MGCESCGTDSVAGCGSGGGCATGGCNKLNTYDWLGNMLGPNEVEIDNVYEVRFKNTRKEFYKNINGLQLNIGDYVTVEGERGHDTGRVSLGGIVAGLQMKKRKKQKHGRFEIRKLYKKASERDLELLTSLRKRELGMISQTRKIILSLKLEMKLSDIEFQGDGTKAIFYYIADHRVDFRALIRELAGTFRIRVEMKQIGLRFEAGLVGGIGSCGRELCCSTWLTDFKTVTTSAARYQNISLNPMKISGQCGRLKCCLNFELDSYMDAIKKFPKIDRLNTKLGIAFLQKTDIFKGIMWFCYPKETNWHPLDVDTVNKIITMNKEGKPPESLSVLLEALNPKEETIDFVDVVGTELPDMPERRGKRGRGNRNNSNRRKGNQKRGNQTQKQSPQKNRTQAKKQTSKKPISKEKNKENKKENKNENKSQTPKTKNTNRRNKNRYRKGKDNKNTEGNQKPKGPENKKS